MKPITKSKSSLLPFFYNKKYVTYKIRNKKVKITVDPLKVFPPSETTIVLAETLLGVKAINALEVGTGSGLLSIVLAKSKCTNVVAIDINKAAIVCAKENILLNHITGIVHCKRANFLSWKPKMRFDLIVSNPPFMPMPKNTKFLSDEITCAINGGKDGTEIILAFALAARNILNVDGRFIFGLPGFVNQNKVFKKLSRYFEIRILLKRNIRYWLAEYGNTYRKHILRQVASGKSETYQDGQLLYSKLSIIECRLAKK
jgi:HemK-related putative methylase